MYNCEHSFERLFGQLVKQLLKPLLKQTIELTSFCFISNNLFFAQHKMQLSQKIPLFYNILVGLSYVSACQYSTYLNNEAPYYLDRLTKLCTEPLV